MVEFCAFAQSYPFFILGIASTHGARHFGHTSGRFSPRLACYPDSHHYVKGPLSAYPFLSILAFTFHHSRLSLISCCVVRVLHKSQWLFRSGMACLALLATMLLRRYFESRILLAPVSGNRQFRKVAPRLAI